MDGVVEVPHGEVDGPDVAHLPRLLEVVAQLLHQVDALLVAGQGVVIVRYFPESLPTKYSINAGIVVGYLL